MTQIEPILAWRVWRLRIDPETGTVQPVLESCVDGTQWPEREPLAFSCREHAAPEPGCDCGIRAVRTHATALDWARSAGSELENPIAVGRVQLWGRVLPEGEGYRAQLAYPYELAVLAGRVVDAADARRLERLLQAAYLVDVAA